MLLDACSEAVAGVDDLHRLLAGGRIGVELALEVLRGGERLPLVVTPSPSPGR